MIEKICSDLPDGRLPRLDAGSTRVRAKRALHFSGVVGRICLLVNGLENRNRRLFLRLPQKVGPTCSFLTETGVQVSSESFFDRFKGLSHEVRLA